MAFALRRIFKKDESESSPVETVDPKAPSGQAEPTKDEPEKGKHSEGACCGSCS